MLANLLRSIVHVMTNLDIVEDAYGINFKTC